MYVSYVRMSVCPSVIGNIHCRVLLRCMFVCMYVIDVITDISLVYIIGAQWPIHDKTYKHTNIQLLTSAMPPLPYKSYFQ